MKNLAPRDAAILLIGEGCRGNPSAREECSKLPASDGERILVSAREAELSELHRGKMMKGGSPSGPSMNGLYPLKMGA
jgi:hypothetical protein